MDTIIPVRLKVMGDPVRLQLLLLLQERGETCVCELVDAVGTSQSNVSMQLRQLRSAGLVASQKIGKWVFYRLDRAGLDELLGWLTAQFDPAAAGQDRPAGSLFSCCQTGDVPLSLAEAQSRLVCCPPREGKCCDE